ncbi:hypothetical protein Tco_0144135 [Tanacetum coccineum]
MQHTNKTNIKSSDEESKSQRIEINRSDLNPKRNSSNQNASNPLTTSLHYLLLEFKKKREGKWKKFRKRNKREKMVNLLANGILTNEPTSFSLMENDINETGFPAQSVGSSNTDVLDFPCLLVLITGTSQSRQHVDTSLIHIESRKSPTAVLFDDDTGRISIRHCEY